MAAPASPAPYQSPWAPSPSPSAATPIPTTVALIQHRASKILPDFFSPPLIAMIAVIGTAVLIVLYARLVSRHIRRLLRRWCRYRRRRRLLLSSAGDPDSPSPNSFDHSTDYFFSPYGLDDSAIKSLPLSIFEFAPKRLQSLDCAVCLLEFEAGDGLRTLPLCAHAFHVDCIDVWLRSHATCPLCRAAVLRRDHPIFVPMSAARIRPSLDDILIFDPPDDPEITADPAAASPPPDRRFLLKRSYSFGFERSLAADRLVLEAATASPWRYRHRGSGGLWSKRWPSPFTGSSSASRAARVFPFGGSQRGGTLFAVKSPFAKRRGGLGFFPLSERSAPGPSARRSRAMTSPSAIFARGISSSRMRCGDPEALLSPERLDRR